MKCEHCKKTYKTANGLKIHRCKTNKFQCDKCFTRYRTGSELAKHKCTAVKYTCSFCKKEFAKEKTLFTHQCRTKMRWEDRNKKHVVIGFMAFNAFYKAKFRQEKTYDTFMKSLYYADFVKFGRHILEMQIKIVTPFVDYLIKREIPLNMWTASITHDNFLNSRNTKESWEDGMARSIETMHEWGGENWLHYFDEIPTVAAVNHIQRGKFSPWLFYSSDKAKQLVGRMNEEQILMIADFLNPAIWRLKIKKDWFEDVCKFVSEIGL